MLPGGGALTGSALLLQEGHLPEQRQAWNAAVRASLQGGETRKALRLLFDKGIAFPWAAFHTIPSAATSAGMQFTSSHTQVRGNYRRPL